MTTIYIRQNGSGQQSSSDQVSWTNITWPLSIPGNRTVQFVNYIRLTSADCYLICQGDNITIGSPTVNPNGIPYQIAVDDVANYGGFVQNIGYSNIIIYNLSIVPFNSTLSGSGGWVGRYQYGTDGTNNYIFGCITQGPIAQFCGGIVGGEAATVNVATSADLTIVGCVSTGTIGQDAGGIVGEYCGQNSGSTVNIIGCASSGSIGTNAGGIVGIYAGQGGATCSIQKCYSRGAIGTNAGGIFGQNAGDGGTATAQNCYSRGTIGTGAGGIFGANAGSSSGTASATNCYCIASGGGEGIFGTGAGGASTLNCYVANINWSDIAANALLTGLSTVWISIIPNTPYSLRNFGPSPYSLTTVVDEDMSLTFSQSVQPGSSTIAGVLDKLFDYLIVDGGNETITIDSDTGVITTTSSTSPDTYFLIIRAKSPYSSTIHTITTFVLTVTGTTQPIAVQVKKGLVPDASTYTASRRIGVNSQGTNGIDPTKIRAPLFYSFYKPYYKTNLLNI